MGAGASAAVTAAAAAEAARRKRDEEESMTAYRRDELDDGWEFKIIRSATSVFAKPDRMRRILEDEARAGWVLVEKFDDSRLRLKRPADARRSDDMLDFDPYRTQVGMTENQLGLWIVAGLLVVAALVGLGVFLLRR